MSEYDPEEENKKTIKHKILLDTSAREKELQNKLEDALTEKGNLEAKIGIYATRAFEKLKDEARNLNIDQTIIDSIQDPKDLEKIVFARKNPEISPSTPENKGSGGSGHALLGPNYSEGINRASNPDMPNESGSVEQWEHYFEQKLIKTINDLKGRGLSGNEIAKRSVEQLAEWNLSVIKPKGLILKEKSNLRAKQEKALNRLVDKIFIHLQKQDEIRGKHSEW